MPLPEALDAFVDEAQGEVTRAAFLADDDTPLGVKEGAVAGFVNAVMAN